MSETIKNDSNNVSSITKMLVGGGVVGLILWKTPIADLLYLFAMVVVVPMALFAGSGLIGQGTYEAFKGTVESWRDRNKPAQPPPPETKKRQPQKPKNKTEKKPTASTARPAETPAPTTAQEPPTPRRRGRPRTEAQAT